MRILLPFLLLAAALAACNPPPPASQSVRYPTTGSVERLDPGLDAFIAPGAKIEVLADSFSWSEGPLWIESGSFLIFSDVPENRILKWTEDGGDVEYLMPSGYTGDPATPGEGANGLLLDPQGRLVLCQHGDRRVAYMDAPLGAPEERYVTLAGSYGGKRFNSPNDACYDRAGNLYFTDPPYGLPLGPDDTVNRELPFQGVYRLAPDGTVSLLVDSLTKPNGIALSPDERTLYVAVSDPERAWILAYALGPDGSITGSRLFYDATSFTGSDNKGLPDGLKVHPSGTLFATGPGGVHVISPEGKALGIIRTGQATANCGFGGGYLYMTAHMYLMRIRLR